MFQLSQANSAPVAPIVSPQPPSAIVPANPVIAAPEVNAPVHAELNISDTKPAQPAVTKNIEIEKLVEPVNPRVKVTFWGNKSTPNNMFGEPTKTSTEHAASNQAGVQGAQTQSQAPPQYLNAPNATGALGTAPAKTKDDMASSANLIVMMIDIIFSNGLKFLAKSDNVSEFTLDASQKKMMIVGWTDFLFEKQTKMSPALALFLSMISVYAFLVPKALQDRKRNVARLAKANPDAGKPTGKVMDKKPDTATPAPAASTEKKADTSASATTTSANSAVPVEKKTEAAAVQTPAAIIKEANTAESGSNSQDSDTGVNKSPLGYIIGKHWTCPDPNIIIETKEEFYLYYDKGIYPMWKRNKINKKERLMKYNEETGAPIFQGAPSKG